MSDRRAGRPLRVLLVDDDPVFSGLGVGTLDRRVGLSAEAAAAPRAALDVLGTRSIDAVVSDYELPGEDADGLDLYRIVRARWPTLPFVFFTGTPIGTLSGSVDLRTDPAAAYVRKGCLPERYDVLARRIERIAGGDRPTGSGWGATVRAIEEFCR